MEPNRNILSVDEKKKFLVALATGKIDVRNIKDVPARTFKRVTPVNSDELTGIGDGNSRNIKLNIPPDAIFICEEDGKEYLYNQIRKMADKLVTGFDHGVGIYFDYTAVDFISIDATSKEQLIQDHLKFL